MKGPVTLIAVMLALLVGALYGNGLAVRLPPDRYSLMLAVKTKDGRILFAPTITGIWSQRDCQALGASIVGDLVQDQPFGIDLVHTECVHVVPDTKPDPHSIPDPSHQT